MNAVMRKITEISKMPFSDQFFWCLQLTDEFLLAHTSLGAFHLGRCETLQQTGFISNMDEGLITKGSHKRLSVEDNVPRRRRLKFRQAGGDGDHPETPLVTVAMLNLQPENDSGSFIRSSASLRGP